MLRSDLRDLHRFVIACVIFPKPTLRRKVILVLFMDAKRNVVCIYRQWTRAGGINADPNHLSGRKARVFGRLFQRAGYRVSQPQKIIARVLPGNMMITGIKKNTVPAGWIINDGTPNFPAIRTIHNDRSNGIGSVIDPNGE